MFSKAPRFQEPKPSDIPGPGAYDPVDIDEIFTGRLKRGAFLEKADRFDPNKPSDTPGSPNQHVSCLHDLTALQFQGLMLMLLHNRMRVHPSPSRCLVLL